VAAVVLWTVLRDTISMPLLLAIIIGPVAPWIVLLPLMARWMRRRTIRAIELMLQNLSQAAKLER
jgi:hypothetical protein